jgi:hypothetical protein
MRTLQTTSERQQQGTVIFPLAWRTLPQWPQADRGRQVALLARLHPTCRPLLLPH